jgi:hypothetical protein
MAREAERSTPTVSFTQPDAFPISTTCSSMSDVWNVPAGAFS